MLQPPAAVVAIVGSREYPKLDAVAEYVRDLPEGTIVISGGARGVDRTAENTARDLGFECISVRPVQHGAEYMVSLFATPGVPSDLRRAIDAQVRGVRFTDFRKAALFRNGVIVANAHRVVAFHHGNSSGTANALSHARSIGRPVEVR